MDLFAAANELFWATWQGELDYVGDQLSELQLTLESMIDPGTAGDIYNRVNAFWLWAKGDVNESINRLRRLKVEAQASGDLQGLSTVTVFSFGPLVELGEYDEAEANIDEAIKISDRGLGGKILPRMLKLSLPQVHGDDEMSQQLMEEIRREAEQNDTLTNRTWLHIAQAHYLATTGQWQEANLSFDVSMNLASKMDLKSIAHWMCSYSERLIDSKIPENLVRAREYLEGVRKLFEEMGAPYYISRVDALARKIDEHFDSGN